MKRAFILLVVLIAPLAIYAQEGYVKKSFLIVYAGKNYHDAKQVAKESSIMLDINIDLRGYDYDKKNEQLQSAVICECGEEHDYIARGRFDDGDYISIEESGSYEGFAHGYYIVIVSSGNKKLVKKLLPNIKHYYKDAYIKSANIYMGCMH